MGKKSKKRNKLRLQKLDEMFNNDDADMADMPDVGRQGAKERTKLSKKARKKQLRRMMNQTLNKNKESGVRDGWYKVEVKGDTPLEREFLMSSITSIIDVEFKPLGYYRIDKSSCFYLENNESAAKAIEGLDRRLQGPDGCRMKISAQKCNEPNLILNADQLQVLRLCLANRYNQNSSLLDISNLHNDPVLIDKDILATLQSQTIMKQVLRLIKENIPELKALSLSKNKLRRNDFSALQSLHTESSQLAALNLEHNNISDLKVLNMIKMFPLKELNMQFNPVVESYKDRPVMYIKEVKARLGGLKVLDTIDIDRYLAENDKPTPSKMKMNINFSKNEAILCSSEEDSNVKVTEATVRMFLDQYYGLIDTAERTNLVAAYTPDAVFEVKSDVVSIGSTIFVGHDKIREALTMFPATQHDHGSFSLKIQVISSKITRAEITGRCQVAGVNSVVAFLRAMDIVPFNTGFCCSQDRLELKAVDT